MQPPHPHRQNHKLFKANKPSEVVPFISYASIEPSKIHHHVKNRLNKMSWFAKICIVPSFLF